MNYGTPVATGTALATAAISTMVVLAPAASASPQPVPAGATAEASAHVLRVDVARTRGLESARVRVGAALGDLGAGVPRVTAGARNLRGSLLDLAERGGLAQADQSAPPDNDAPTTGSFVPGRLPLSAPEVLDPGLTEAWAHARFNADGTCRVGEPQVSDARVSTADLDVLDGTVELLGTASVRQSVRFEPRADDARQVDVVSTAVGSLADLRVAGSPVISVLSPPRLEVRAGGGSVSRTYTPALVAVGGRPVRPGTTQRVLAADGHVLELSVGGAGEPPLDGDLGHEASATTLHLTLLRPGGEDVAAEVDLFPLTAAAGSPAGGTVCGDLNTDDDFDGLTNDQEKEVTGTDPTNADTDGDGTKDGAEDNDGDGLTNLQELSGSENDLYRNEPTDPADPDSDADGLSDGAEALSAATDANAQDSDGDGTLDPDEDPDLDGLDNLQETTGSANVGFGKAPTDPLNHDTDRGGLNDGDEVAASKNPHDADDDQAKPPAETDTDGDGLSDAEETETHGTDPTGADSDGDGLDDGREVMLTRTDPRRADSDGDGLDDGEEVDRRRTDPSNPDTDGDGLTDGDEVNGVTVGQRCFYQRGSATIGTVRTDPRRADSDGDGLRDAREVRGTKVNQRVRLAGGRTILLRRVRSHPRRADSDRDGLRDGVEVKGSRNRRYGSPASDPCRADTDRGGIDDGDEARHGTNPVNAQHNRRRV